MNGKIKETLKYFKMRRTGRTRRIVNHTVEQLMSVGEVIVTDHIVYEYPDTSQRMLQPFVDNVKREVKLKFSSDVILEHKFIRVLDRWMIHFKLTRKI